MRQKILMKKKKSGRPLSFNSDLEVKAIIKSIMFKLFEGVSWENVPIFDNFPYTFSVVYDRFILWGALDVFEKIWQDALKIYSKKIRISWKVQSLDASMIKTLKGGETIGPNHYDRNRNGCKVTMIVDGNGIPLSFIITSANESDVKVAPAVLDEYRIRKPSYNEQTLNADKGYDSEHFRTIVREHGMTPNIPHRKSVNHPNSFETPEQYEIAKQRIKSEHTFAIEKQAKSIRNRSDVYIKSYENFICLQSARIILQRTIF